MDTTETDDSSGDNTSHSLFTRSNILRRNQVYRCVVICLGSLCAVLLAGNVGQMIYYRTVSRPSSMNAKQANYEALTQNKSDVMTTKSDQLQSSYDALIVEKKQLDMVLSNLTVEKELLQQSYKSANTEKDELEDSLKTVTSERDQLQANYSALKQESEQLKTSYNDAQKSLEGLQTDRNDLSTNINQLPNKYNNTEREKSELQTHFTRLVAERDQLESNYSSLRRNNDQLQRSFDILNATKSQTQTSYNSLWGDKNQLQSRYNTLTREKEELQTNYSSLAADRDQLQQDLNKLALKLRGIICQTQWTKFDTSCYFVSTTKKNWTESRQACIAEGADLVIIDSHDEQVFLNGLLHISQNAWIGLTDRVKEETWMWVDGTPVTTTFWGAGQPNSYYGDQDCGEIFQSSPGGGWNDDGCFAEQNWICEK